MEMEVVCLGTSSQAPSIKKNHSGYLVKTENHKILVDCGEGIQRQFRVAEENPARLTHILLTHWHEDHTLGLAGILKTMGMNSYVQTLKIYGPKHTREKISILEHLYNKFKISMEIHEVEHGTIYEDKDLKIETTPMDHGIPTVAYNIIIKDKIRLDKAKLKKLKLPNSPLIGDLQRGKDIKFNGKTIKAKSVTYHQEGKKLSIILDTAFNSRAIDFANGADLLICESSYAKDEEELAHEYKHLTTKQAGEIAKKAKASKLAIVHISEKHTHHAHHLLKEAKTVFKNTIMPSDFDVLKV